MIRLTASLPPLEIQWVSNRARTCSRHIRSVRPRRATSGIGQLGNEAMTCSATARPAAWGVGLVHRAELLVGMPGQGDLPAGVAGGQAGVEFGDLPFTQVFSA